MRCFFFFFFYVDVSAASGATIVDIVFFDTPDERAHTRRSLCRTEYQEIADMAPTSVRGGAAAMSSPYTPFPRCATDAFRVCLMRGEGSVRQNRPGFALQRRTAEYATSEPRYAAEARLSSRVTLYTHTHLLQRTFSPAFMPPPSPAIVRRCRLRRDEN